MALRFFALTFGVALVATASGQAASAQVRSLGNAIGGAFAKEAQAIRQAEERPAQEQAADTGKPAPPAPPAAEPRGQSGRVVQTQLTRGDALADTAATTCRQANGTTIRVSGGYRPAAGDSTVCR